MKTADVTFDGQPLVLIRFDDGEGALAFRDQIEGDRIRIDCLLEPGFAHIDSDGQIWRHGNSSENATTHPDLAAAWAELGELRRAAR